ncbi:MAG: hypothetical protein U9R36_02290, partial [Elusimicrobiota bacterium]|nr:hypothetical protein [Elusimicrobiota bacterium]
GMAPAADGTSIPEALVTAGGNMSRIPSTEIPFVNSSGGGFTIGENAPTVSVKYDTSNLGAGNESASNESFAYDPGEVELWLAVTGVDTKGVGIHQW